MFEILIFFFFLNVSLFIILIKCDLNSKREAYNYVKLAFSPSKTRHGMGQIWVVVDIGGMKVFSLPWGGGGEKGCKTIYQRQD